MGLFRRKKEPEQRDWLSDSWSLPQRSPYFTTAGPFVDLPSTLGISTASACVKLVSESIGMMPLKVYRGEKPEVAEARSAWQWFRLKEQPNDEQSAFDFWQDAAGSIETSGNAYIWKAIARRPVQDENDLQLILIDPSQVFCKRDENNRKYYEVRRNRGTLERVAASQILHIRGWAAIAGADTGVSPLTMHRESIGAALAAQEFSSRFYSNGTVMPGWITVPGTPTQEDLDRFQTEWQQRHAGLAQAHRPGILGNGATWVPTGLSMRDAQYIETQRFSAEEVCRIFRVTPGMLGITPAETQPRPTDDDIERFLQVDLAPRLRRIEMALMRDMDLFPAGGNLFPEFLTNSVLRPSMQTRFAAYKDALQGGWETANEVRELENRPPKDGGDELQQTPVGGAPNPAAANQGDTANE